MKGEKFGTRREDRSHISAEEKKRSFVMFILIGILVAILLLIVIIMIPKGGKKDNVKDASSQVDSSMLNNDDKNKSNDDDAIKRDKEKVTITVEKDTLTEDGAVITITDTNTNPYKWTPIYRLQEKVDGEWEDMELLNPENAIFPDTETENPTGTMTQSLVWVNKYGKLKSGTQYRIVKESDGTKFYAEFKID